MNTMFGKFRVERHITTDVKYVFIVKSGKHRYDHYKAISFGCIEPVAATVHHFRMWVLKILRDEYWMEIFERGRTREPFVEEDKNDTDFHVVDWQMVVWMNKEARYNLYDILLDSLIEEMEERDVIR